MGRSAWAGGSGARSSHLGRLEPPESEVRGGLLRGQVVQLHARPRPDAGQLVPLGEGGGLARPEQDSGTGFRWRRRKTTIFTGTDVQRLAEQPQAGAATWTTSSWARVSHARPGLLPHPGPICGPAGERASDATGAEFSWGPNGHELRVVLPRLRSRRSHRGRVGPDRGRPCLSSRPCFSCSSGSVGRLIVSLLAWCAPAAGGAVLRERTDPPASEVVRFVLVEGPRAGSCARSEHPTSLRNSPGRLTVPSMSRHGWLRALRHESAVEAMVRQYSTDQAVASLPGAMHRIKRAGWNEDSEGVADPLEPRTEQLIYLRMDTWRRPAGAA